MSVCYRRDPVQYPLIYVSVLSVFLNNSCLIRLCSIILRLKPTALDLVSHNFYTLTLETHSNHTSLLGFFLSLLPFRDHFMYGVTLANFCTNMY